MNTSPADTPIACTAPADAGPEGIAEYQRLFGEALVGRERTADGIRFRFRAADGIEAWVRDLAAREKACCAFFTFTITRVGGEVVWDATVVDDPIARGVLDEFYALPETVAQGVDELRDRFTERGLTFSPDAGAVTEAGSGALDAGAAGRGHRRASWRPWPGGCWGTGPHIFAFGYPVQAHGWRDCCLICAFMRQSAICSCRWMSGPRGT